MRQAYINYMKEEDDHIEYTVIRKSDGDSSLVLIDKDDVDKIDYISITRSQHKKYKNYCKKYAVSNGIQISHLVMDHSSNMETVVDHINGNSLDNRKANLRIVTQRENASNVKNNSRCRTGTIGISERKTGGYHCYRATVSDRITPVASKAHGQTKRYCKHFNINKLGKEKAFELANKWLKEKKDEYGYLN